MVDVIPEPEGPAREPLARLPAISTVCSTNDVDAASAVLSESYADLELQVRRPAVGLALRLESVDLPDVQLALLDLSTAWARTVPYPNYTVCFPVRGRVRVGAGSGRELVGQRRGVTVGPHSGEIEVDYLSAHCRVFTVTVERRALEDELEVMLGRPLHSPIRFDFGLDVGRCASLHRALALVRAELDEPAGLLSHVTNARRLSRLLMAAILLGPGHEWTEELHRPSGFEGPRAIRLALALIEERPTELATVADLARASNLSVRALEDGFRRHVGTTPMAYLRGVRLARAHDELVEADPGDVTASAIAQRWGFAHYGRFSAEYRQRFGCSPGETLRGGGWAPPGAASRRRPAHGPTGSGPAAVQPARDPAPASSLRSTKPS